MIGNLVQAATTSNSVIQDYGSFSESKKDGGMKVCRGPFSLNCTTSKDPQLILYEMAKALDLQKVSFKKVIHHLFS
jgi:hypothetical protein